MITYFNYNESPTKGSVAPHKPSSEPSVQQLPTPKSLDSPSPKDTKEPSARTETPEERLRRISRLLEQMSIDDVDAVNNRDFAPTSALFRNKASYWEATTTAALAVKKLTVQGFVDSIQKKCDMSPEFKLRIIDFTTTVDEGQGKAEIFANMEVTSGDGIAQRNVTVLEYHCIDAKWYHVSHRTMPGMDPMSMNFG